MSINKVTYKGILNDLNVGNSVAELDSILESARVETPIFDGVLTDRYDIILGRKGAGKTAMFKILNILSPILRRQKLVILSGVNVSGEAIFNQFKKELALFSEREFETFWKFYFVTLIYNDFLKNEKFSQDLENCEAEIRKFVAECEKAGIPNIPAQQKRSQMIAWILNAIPKGIKSISAEVEVDSNTPTLFKIKPEVVFDSLSTKEKHNDTSVESLHVQDICEALRNILIKSGLKIWILLDRLDEVFDRYSRVEFRGLRGLLTAYKNFVIDDGEKILRIKLFLRDDIVDFLTDSTIYKAYFKNQEISPLPAATHIFAKQSPTLNWDEDEIEQLVLNRLLLSAKLRTFVEIPELSADEEIRALLRTKGQRLSYWNMIFPETISSSPSLKWIFTRLKDGNDIVTPRSVIDTLEGAIDYQKRKLALDFKDCEEIFSLDSIKNGLKTASINKLEKDIFNEFPKDQESIKILGREGKIKLKKSELRSIYGKNWEQTVSNLKRIGIIQYVKDSDTYRVVQLFRPALHMAYSS